MSHGDHRPHRLQPQGHKWLRALARPTIAIALAIAAVPALAQYAYRRTITVDRTKVTNPATLPIAFDNVTSTVSANAGASNLSWPHTVGSGNDKLAIVAVSSKRDPSPLPTFVAVGTVANAGAATITPALPGTIQTNDILLLFVESANQAITISNQNGGTWTEAPSSPQGTGTAGTDAGTRLTVFWSRYNGTQGAPTVAATTDHAVGRIIAVRGCITSGDPFDVTSGGVEATADTSGSVPGATTTVANTLVVAAITSSYDGASTTMFGNTWTNASLTSPTERIDNNVADGTGGGIGVATGGKATAGAYVATTNTLAQSVYKALWSGALNPPPVTITQVMFGATDITGNLIGTATNTDNCEVSMYYLKNPTAGANTVSVTQSASTRFVAGAFTFFNVDQTTTFGTFASGTDSGSSGDPLSIFSVPSANGEIAVGALAKTYNYSISAEAQNQQADRWNLWTSDATAANNILGIGALRGGAASALFEWRLTDSTTQQMAFGGVSVKPTTAAAPSITTLSNYPLLVSLSDGTLMDAAHGGHVQSSSGHDIVFTASDGVTRLDHELESYDGTTGRVVAWVRLPSVNGSGSVSDTVIYIYYGNPAITSPTQNKAAVWDSDYMDVFHLAELAGNATDSTSHGYVGSITNDPNVTRQAGKIGGAYHFGGSSYIVANDGQFTVANAPLTMEAWFYLDSVPQTWVGMITKNRDVQPCTGNQPPCHWAGIATGNSGEMAYYWDWHTQGNQDTGPVLSAATWYHAVLTFDGGIRTAYRNGVRDTIVTAPNPSPGTYDSLTMPSRINQDMLGSNIGTDIIDEVRISTVARTPGWVLTSYNNMNNPGNIGTPGFYTVGAEGPIALYRSVGTNAANLNSGGPTVTISGTTATFSAAMPTNVGVGDVLTYTSGTAQLAFISGRTSSTVFTVQNKNGGTPTAASGATVGVYRAYTSLANWQSQTKNPNIVEPSAGDVNPSKNLVSANTIMNVACYYGGAADSAAVTITGWTTSASNYIKIFTPNLPSEVGATQRHNGKWDANKYSIQAANVPVVNITGAGNVWIDGLQVYSSTTNSNGSAGIAINQDGLAADHRISNNIIRGVTGSASGVYGIYGGDAAASGNSVRIWNNIVFGFGNGTGIYTDGDNGAAITFYAYNNTVYGCLRGYMRSGASAGAFVAKNNIAYSNTDNYNNAAAFDVASRNNLSGPGSDPNIPPTGARDGVPVTFVDTGSPPDLHLASTDTGAKDYGADLSADPNLAFSDDIDGQGRPYGSAWDIGADEAGSGLFQYRRLITVLDLMTPSSCTTNLSNFPVLVTITNDPELRTMANGGHVQNANGYDIVFRGTDATTCGGAALPCTLDHEIESYVGANGTLVAWVRIPTLVYNAATTFYMYYGNPGISSPSANPTGVWNTSYGWRGVWHLGESGGNRADSTALANTLTDTNTVASGTGKADGAALFDYTSSERLTRADDNNLDPGAQVTFSAWVNPSQPATASIIDKDNAAARGYRLRQNTSGWFDCNVWDATGATNSPSRSTTTWSTGSWYHLACTYDGSNVGVYVNGTNEATYPFAGGVSDSPNAFQLGARAAGQYFGGLMDEVRVSATARNACWIGTEYNNVTTPGMVVVEGSGMTVKSGSYTGNGVDARRITGLGFKPDIVIIKADATQDPVCTTSSMPAYSSKRLGSTAAALVANNIKTLDVDGFTLGTDAQVNSATACGGPCTYYWVAFRAGVGELKVGTYQGNGAARGITGVGFQPDWVAVMSSAANSSRHRSSTMTTPATGTAYFHDWTSDATGIASLDADGFSVDTDATVNTSGTTYHYFAFKQVTGKMKVGWYDGNSTDNTDITGVGFQPEYVLIKASNDGQRAVAHPASLAGDLSTSFGTVVNEANHIQAFLTDGFQIGSSNRTNLTGDRYHWVAFGPSGSIGAEQPAGPTAVRLASLSATQHGSTVLLEWTTGFEVDNLGFHVYREVNGERVQITPSLIAGSALIAGAGTRLTAGQSYAWWDRAPLAGASYWLEEWELSGARRWHGPVAVEPASAEGQAQALSVPASGGSVQTSSPLLAGFGQPAAPSPAQGVRRKLRQGVGAGPDRLAVQWGLAAHPAVKILVTEEGWYRVNQEDLAAAGLAPDVDPGTLQLYTDGQQVPILVNSGQPGRFASGDRIEFYGEGLDTPSTAVRVYWLVVGSGEGLRIPELGSGGRWTAGPASFPYEVERADRTIYVPSLLNGDEENFFGAVVTTTPVRETVRAQHPDRSGDAVLTVRLQGLTQVPHAVGVELNGTRVGTVAWQGVEVGELAVQVGGHMIVEGDNLVVLAADGGQGDVSAVESIRLQYAHTWQADREALKFSLGGYQEVSISGFTSSQVRVVDTTDPRAVQALSSEVVKDGESYAVTVGIPEPGERTVLAVGTGAVRHPVGVLPNRPSAWHAATNGADLLIIAHRATVAALAPLRTLRENQGLKVAVVDVENVFDEFSYGAKDPQAIRDFIAYARATWARPPRYLLLVGDASYDPRNHLGYGFFDLVPTKLVDTRYMETASDDWFADFNGDGIADIPVGRLPVQTTHQAETVVAKIVAYESSAASGRVLLVADVNDQENDFEGMSGGVEALVPSSLTTNEVYRGKLGGAAKDELTGQLYSGQALVNYIGHGSMEVWHGNLLTTAQARTLVNARLPLWLPMTCLNGYFQAPYGDSLAEALLEAPSGGAIAVWASSGLTESKDQIPIDKALVSLLFSTTPPTLGDATLAAKAVAENPDVRRTWILFGDPTTRLRR